MQEGETAEGEERLGRKLYPQNVMKMKMKEACREDDMVEENLLMRASLYVIPSAGDERCKTEQEASD